MIKLIDYGPGVKSGKKLTETIYIDKKDISIMIGKNDGQYDREYTYLLVRGGSTHYVKETPEEILAMPDIEEGGKTINWEQRRYEIAKEMLPVIYYDDKPQEGEDYLTLNQAANEAVRYAEALITELKKGTEQ